MDAKRHRARVHHINASAENPATPQVACSCPRNTFRASNLLINSIRSPSHSCPIAISSFQSSKNPGCFVLSDLPVSVPVERPTSDSPCPIKLRLRWSFGYHSPLPASAMASPYLARPVDNLGHATHPALRTFCHMAERRA